MPGIYLTSLSGTIASYLAVLVLWDSPRITFLLTEPVRSALIKS